MPRRAQHYKTTWGQVVVGLARNRDGRWRVMATGYRFTEPDECKAIEKFRELTCESAPQPRLEEQRAGGVMFAGVYVPEPLLYRWVNEQIRNHRVAFAKKVGIPALARLDEADVPKPAIRLEMILDIYKKHAEVLPRSRRYAVKRFEDFMKITRARTLADLTTDVLTLYRDTIKSRVASPGTVANYFGVVKWVVRFAKSEGQDAVQIDAALSRMAVLKAPRGTRVHEPRPISSENFGKLLAVARKDYPSWEPRLLVMLNLCLHFDEALAIEWADLDLVGETFCTRRNKRGRVIRCATLWPETVQSLKTIQRTDGPYLFTSAYGTRFNTSGQWKTWEKIRKAAGLPNVQLDDIRDGAYTAACNASGVEEKFARLLAGHRSHGLQDNYVARNPTIVRGACDAVREVFAKAIESTTR